MNPRRYVFSYAGNLGPVRKVFTSVSAFDGYVGFWRSHVSAVTFDSPWVARGSL